ncbi:hypothetical protein MCHI_001080 [Candidatus Magnetoovum chiemensis]|nr:hypothetical protein MCHI_001080 [Candidatus Magnetoovum chiemensis]
MFIRLYTILPDLIGLLEKFQLPQLVLFQNHLLLKLFQLRKKQISTP